jgi:hypothetical protein
MNHKEHRIYQYLSEPFTILGLTLDEMGMGACGIFGALYFDVLWLKTVSLGVGIIGVFVVKKVKKMISGFSMGSFLNWYFGLLPKKSSSSPESWKRFWLS